MIEIHFPKRRRKRTKEKKTKSGKRNLLSWVKGKDVLEERHGSVHAVEKKIPDISLEVVLQPQW